MKKIILSVFFILAGMIMPAKVSAWAPYVYGYVKTKTGMGISGVAVKWVDGNGSVRYVFTDSQGKFFYSIYSKLSRDERLREYNNFIDTDLDGTAESRECSIQPEAPGEDPHHGFGCSTNPHYITAVMPKGWTGAFSVPPPFDQDSPTDLNNSVAEVRVVDIIYDPFAVTPTPIPPTTAYVPLTRTPVSCICEEAKVSGNYVIGGSMLINIFARSLFPETIPVQGMTYHVARNGVETGQSVYVPAELVSAVGGKYQTSWLYNIPADPGASGQYHIWADLACLDGNATPTGFSPPITSAYGLGGTVAVLAPSGVNSLQLGTFFPIVNMQIGCKDIYFTIP